MLISKEEAIAEANRWLKEREVSGIEVVGYRPQGDGVAWEINTAPGDERFNELAEDLREHLNAWVKKVLAERAR